MSKVGFLITARLKSARLPQKVIKEVNGKPLLVYMIERIRAASLIDVIVVCTSTNPEDDPLETIARQEGVECFRGSEDDVLERLNGAAERHQLDYIVNITADCPLVDPFFIDETYRVFQETNADFIQWKELPIGQGFNGIKPSALARVCELKNENDTEIWGNYFYKCEEFQCVVPEVADNYKYDGLKTSVDYPEDYEFVSNIIERLYREGDVFSLQDLLDLVRREPSLVEINSHCIAQGRAHWKNSATVKFK